MLTLENRASLLHVRLQGRLQGPAQGCAPDPLRARQMLEQALAPVEWMPCGLPPRAVLLVRRIRVAAPDGSALGTRVSQTLREQVRTAQRPWLQAGAQADAVWFADEAELAACLVRDWLRAGLHEHWWWKTVLGSSVLSSWLDLNVLDRADRLVPIAQHLASRGLAAAFVSRLSVAQAGRATAALLPSHGFAAASNRALPIPPAADLSAPAPWGRAATDTAGADTEAGVRRLLAIVPELVGPVQHVTHRRLLAAVLLAGRCPTWIRTPQFARVWHAWTAPSAQVVARNGVTSAWSATSGPRAPVPGRLPPVTLPPDAAGVARRRRAGSPAGGHASRMPAAQAVPDPVVPAPPAAPATDQAYPSAHYRSSAGPLPARAAHGADAKHMRDEGSQWPAPSPAWAALLQGSASVSAAQALPALPPGEGAPEGTGFHTRFGGLFYLLNAAIAMGLYGDFTSPRQPGIALSPWDFLAIAGRAWFGDTFTGDPLSPALASLSGRDPRQCPGAAFTTPADWAVEPAWLAPWGPVRCVQYRSTRKGLQAWHPAGFRIFDLARRSCTPRLQLRELCRRHACLRDAGLQRGASRLAPSRRQGTAGSGRDQRRCDRICDRIWLQCLLEYLAARLAVALGEGIEPRHARELVCCHDAEVLCSLAAVDVRLPLDSLPVAIRCSGLDRDPGWIPAAARAVYFHFDQAAHHEDA